MSPGWNVLRALRGGGAGERDSALVRRPEGPSHHNGFVSRYEPNRLDAFSLTVDSSVPFVRSR